MQRSLFLAASRADLADVRFAREDSDSFCFFRRIHTDADVSIFHIADFG